MDFDTKETILVHNLLHEKRTSLFRNLCESHTTNEVLIVAYNKVVDLLNKTTKHLIKKGHISSEYASFYDHYDD